MLLLLAVSAISLHMDFEGASLGAVKQIASAHFEAHAIGQKDQDGRNRQASWYYFRVDGAKDQPLTIDLVDLPGEYNYQPNKGAITGDTLPWWSTEQRTWNQFERVEYDASLPRLRLKLTPAANRLWIAHVPPYTNQNLTALLNDLSKNPSVQRTVAGKTVGGRDIVQLSITDRSADAKNKKVIWLMFRQHAWEAGSSWEGEGLMRYLVSPDPVAARIRKETIVNILPLCDPDGVAKGGVRFNTNGYDLNRNWDVTDPVKMPEITAERAAFFKWLDAGHPIDLALTLHNTETAEYLEGPPDTSGAIRPFMMRFFRHLSAGKTFAASREPNIPKASTTPGKPGRMNAPQGLWDARKVPAFLIEMGIAKHPKLGRQPTIEDRKQAGVELMQALWKTVTGQ